MALPLAIPAGLALAKFAGAAKGAAFVGSAAVGAAALHEATKEKGGKKRKVKVVGKTQEAKELIKRFEEQKERIRKGEIKTKITKTKDTTNPQEAAPSLEDINKKQKKLDLELKRLEQLQKNGVDLRGGSEMIENLNSIMAQEEKVV